MKSTCPGVSIRFSSYSVPLVPVRQPDGLGLDRDPALALQVHLVQVLLAHVAVGDGVGELEQAVGERRLPVVDVRDDAEVADPAGSVTARHRTGGDGPASSQRLPASRSLLEGANPLVHSVVHGEHQVSDQAQPSEREGTERNKDVRTALKTASKKVRTAAAEGDAETAQTQAREASRALDKAVSKGIVHKRTAARRKSRLAKAANRAAAPGE